MNSTEPVTDAMPSFSTGFEIANPMAIPLSFTFMCIMFLFHGGFIDIVVINLLPHGPGSPLKGWEPNLSPEKSPAQRRFMAENAAYALIRLAPVFFIKNMGVYILCTISYFLEGASISWEINFYNGTKDT